MKDQKKPIETIVTADDPDLLVEEARSLAGKLRQRDEATQTQVRRLFGTLRQIEMGWPRRAEKPEEIQQRDDAYRELVLFGPRLAYQARRHGGLAPLALLRIGRGVLTVVQDNVGAGNIRVLPTGWQDITDVLKQLVKVGLGR